MQQVLEARSPVTLRKSVKNEAELAGMREAHLRDAVAIVQFLQWLDDQVRCAGLPPRASFLSSGSSSANRIAPVGVCTSLRKNLHDLNTLLICTMFGS